MSDFKNHSLSVDVVLSIYRLCNKITPQDSLLNSIMKSIRGMESVLSSMYKNRSNAIGTINNIGDSIYERGFRKILKHEIVGEYNGRGIAEYLK
ncbi:hypothetical protein [Peribacillus saganii]|uniref:hypothetical protein n=1 Tax=Peribacillus saganii TaxID=2303992 RepID=UPI00115ECF53|nr:hypothetical protein [Peribacillus saganii]